jgi:hypothetical protein
MWLMDHLMNRDLSEKLGQYFARLPLAKSARILQANALRTDWKTLLPPEQCSYVMGNPPFVGKKEQNEEQKADMEAVCGHIKGYGVLDFVTAWYLKAADYMRANPAITCAFVSTNSIAQGEQVGTLWPSLLEWRKNLLCSPYIQVGERGPRQGSCLCRHHWLGTAGYCKRTTFRLRRRQRPSFCTQEHQPLSG